MCLETQAQREDAEVLHGAADEPETDGVVVLKFGSSVLTRPADLPSVVTEIYRHARDGRKVVAVVSAFAGETDRLIAEAAAFGARPGSRHAPRLIALGEERTAALLAIACDQAGLDARIVGPRELDLRAAGPVDDAFPASVSREAIERGLEDHDVLVVPGFVAIGASGEPVLLGRGGSDLTAVVLANALGLGDATLLKDVDGVYDRDPALHGAAALRFARLAWRDAEAVAGKLVQPKAIRFAAERDVRIRVARLDAAEDTVIGEASAPPRPAAARKPLRVAVAGLGVVGGGAALRLLADPTRYDLVGVLVSDLARPRDRQINPMLLTADPDRLIAARPDVVIDALSCGATGRALTMDALGRGVSVVTANKQAIAADLGRLVETAATNGAGFGYSAAVGGGAPMVETARRARIAGRVVRIEAVLNGTVNFILSRMAAGAGFAEALAAAQAAGFAEADPSADLSGADALAKVRILAFEAFRAAPAHVEIEGLDADKAETFRRSGLAVRQIATIARSGDGVVARVAYEPVAERPVFAMLTGEGNALRAELADGRAFTCSGRGAGRTPTVESLLGDLGAIARTDAYGRRRA